MKTLILTIIAISLLTLSGCNNTKDQRPNIEIVEPTEADRTEGQLDYNFNRDTSTVESDHSTQKNPFTQ